MLEMFYFQSFISSQCKFVFSLFLWLIRIGTFLPVCVSVCFVCVCVCYAYA